MDQIHLAQASLIFIPLILLALLIIPGRKAIRVPVSVVLGIVVALALAWGMDKGVLTYLVSFSTMAMIYAILALGLNSQWGLTGHVNFGVAGFFAIGAFTSALITTTMPAGALAAYSEQAFGLNQPFIVGVIAAGIVSAIIGFLIGIPVLRLRTDFLAIATLGIAEIIRLIFQNERWLANGPQPLRGIPQPLKCMFTDPACSWLPHPIATLFAPLGARDYIYFYFLVTAIILTIIYLALERISRSPWGRAQRAVRDEENSAAMSGKPVTYYRIESFVVGSFIMGIAGGIYAAYVVSIDYSHFQPLFATFIVWVMLMLGGSGNNKGAILGAFVVWAVWIGAQSLVELATPMLQAISPDLPARSAYFRWLVVAILLAAIVLYRPEGLLKERKRVSDFMKAEEGD